MLEALLATVADHWALSTYLSVMALNESAILVAFSLSASSGGERIVVILLLSVAASLTNDLAYYLLARYGIGRLIRTPRDDQAAAAKTVFERLFLGNVFWSLLFIKFLFGVRLFLTLYLVTKKQIPLGRFILYDLLGIALYVSVIGGIGLSIGMGNSDLEDPLRLAIRAITAVSVFMLLAHGVRWLIGRYLQSPQS